MQPKTLATIRRALKARTQPTQQELLLSDAARLFRALMKDDDKAFRWSDVRDWLKAYQGYQHAGVTLVDSSNELI